MATHPFQGKIRMDQDRAYRSRIRRHRLCFQYRVNRKTKLRRAEEWTISYRGLRARELRQLQPISFPAVAERKTPAPHSKQKRHLMRPASRQKLRPTNR